MDLFSPYARNEGKEYGFVIEAPTIKFGKGTLKEVGKDAHALGLKRVAVYTDAVVKTLKPMEILRNSLKEAKVEYEIYSDVEVEPTDRSFASGIAFANDGNFDGFISLGGGSVIDTCKASNLYSTYPADLIAYVNAPIGEARTIPGKLKPHIACPTTFGTASECTGIAVFDFLEKKCKTGIVGSALRPTLGLLDPESLESLPPLVTAASGFDVFSHACESYTARPYTERELPTDTAHRPHNQGSNPYGDHACLKAIELMGEHLTRTVIDSNYKAGFEPLMFAGMLAGIGFGNAGNHLPHGMSYPVSGSVKTYKAEGWPEDNPLVPHGISVIVNSPAVFKKTAPYAQDKYYLAAKAVGADMSGVTKTDAGVILAEHIIGMMKETNMPNGLIGVGYTEMDVNILAERAFQQKRLIDNAPLKVSLNNLKEYFTEALCYW